jgi:hypothetical protein
MEIKIHPFLTAAINGGEASVKLPLLGTDAATL